MKALRQQHVQYKDVTYKDKSYRQLLNKAFKLKVSIDELKGDFNLNLENLCDFKYGFNLKVFKLSLGEGGFGRKERAVAFDKLSDVHICGDSSSLEIFLNLGEEVFTTRVYPAEVNRNVKINCNAQIVLDIWSL